MNQLFIFILIASFEIFAITQTIHIGNGAEPKDLDPHVTTGIPEFHIQHNIFEPLVSKHPKTLESVPGVAESWKVSKDGKVYTFNLRKNAKWSNGDPLTAEDFVYSWTRLLLPQTASEYAYQGDYIKNGKDFRLGKVKDASLLGIKAKDSHTLIVTLENPTPFYIKLLYHHSMYPLHKATVEKHGARWTRPENIVTNGAFLLHRWEMNKVIVVKKNPQYWDKDKVTIEEAHFHPVEEQDTEEKMFRSGELHITNEMPIEKIPHWKKQNNGVYQSYPYLGIYHYWINTTKPPLNNKMVRRALVLSIDRERIVKYVALGGQPPATAFTPPGTGVHYFPKPVIPQDTSKLEEAKALLSKAGFPNGKGFPSLEILYNTSDNHKKIAEAVQAMWKQNLGIDVKLFNQEWKVYLDSQQNKNYQISRAGWIGDYNDPNTFLDMFVTNMPTNYSGWSNPTYDDLIAKAGKELNAKKRFDTFQKAEDILLEELPCIPIYVYTRNYLKSKKVEGWYPNIEDVHPLKYVSMTAG